MIKDVLRGDKLLEFEDIYLEYKDDVYRFVNKLCCYQNSLSDDITQETFLKAYRNIAKFRGDSSIKTWLFTIAKNTFFSEIKKKKYENMSMESLEIVDAKGHDEPLDKIERRELLEITLTIIFNLPEKMQAVFLARIYSGDSYEKIAKDIGITVSSAKVLVFRARKHIKRQLREEYGYEV